MLSNINNGVRIATVCNGWVWHVMICYCTCDSTDLKTLCRLAANKTCEPPVVTKLCINEHIICEDWIQSFFMAELHNLVQSVFVEFCRNFFKMSLPCIDFLGNVEQIRTRNYRQAQPSKSEQSDFLEWRFPSSTPLRAAWAWTPYFWRLWL